ncbi:hypothetical protein ABPG72_006443 [Tetrahymena utriculariae]
MLITQTPQIDNLSINIKKQLPHFQFKGFVDVKPQKYYGYVDFDDLVEAFQQDYKSVNMIVFDTNKQMKKILQIYIISFLKENELNHVKSAVKNLNQIDHLILQCYDSYYLPDFSNIQSYFVVEMEFYDLPLESLKNNNRISDFQIFSLYSPFMQYLQNKYCIFDENIMLKHNYLKKNKMKKQNDLNENEIEIEENNDSINEADWLKLDCSFQEKNNYKESEQSQQDYIQNFLKCMNKKIQKQDLVREIKESYPYLIEKYSLDLFENISQHPQYQSYQVNAEIDGCLNLTIRNKQDQKIFLQVYRMIFFQEAQLFSNQMERCAQIKQSIRFNIANVNLIPCEKVNYVLLEKPRIDFCTSIQEMEIENKKKSYFDCSDSDWLIEQQRGFVILQNLINLSQDLLIKKISKLQKSILHIYLRILDESKNSLVLSIDSNNISYFKKLNQTLKNITSYSKESEMVICEDSQINEIMMIGQKCQFKEITIRSSDNLDLCFLSLDIFKSVYQLNIRKQSNFNAIKQLNTFKNILKIVFFDAYSKSEIKNISQFYKLKYILSVNY